jgi:hypothetical protein
LHFKYRSVTTAFISDDYMMIVRHPVPRPRHRQNTPARFTYCLVQFTARFHLYFIVWKCTDSCIYLFERKISDYTLSFHTLILNYFSGHFEWFNSPTSFIGMILH